MPVKPRIFLALLLVPVIFITCRKAGTGGDAEVSVQVQHHESAIPGATVYVKYNAREFPGKDVSGYDASSVCGTSGHSRGHTHLHNLRPGYYYFYATGFDSAVSQTVTGGRSLLIKRSQRKETIDLKIPVTE